LPDLKPKDNERTLAQLVKAKDGIRFKNGLHERYLWHISAIRQLHGLFYFLAVTMVSNPKNGAPNYPVFYNYYIRKIGEEKTKS